MSIRPIKRVVQTKPTIEGAGVKLQRAFGFGNTTDFDPFLLFDDFRNDKPEDYLAAFARFAAESLQVGTLWTSHRFIAGSPVFRILFGVLHGGRGLFRKGRGGVRRHRDGGGGGGVRRRHA